MAVSIWSGDKFNENHLQHSKLKEYLENCTHVFIFWVSENTPQQHLGPENDTPSKRPITETAQIEYLNAKSTIDAAFKLKCHLDALKILSATVLIPKENSDEVSSLVSLLYLQVCNVKVSEYPVKGVLKSWRQLESNESLVKEYLATVPSKDKVKTVKSKMIPSDLFVHGYTTRYGGISTWPTMASLNLIYSLRKPDSILVVKENARRLCQHIGRDHVKYNLAKANHGKNIWVYENEVPEYYDGIVTQTPGVTVASPAADCNMLLLADPVTKSCGAIHAGWKGILLGVVEAAVETMIREYNSNPKDIIASLGPSMSFCCCEFGAEDSKKFLKISEDVVVWKDGKEKPHLDLRLAVRILLIKSGLKPENIDDGVEGANPTSELAVCTKCDPDKNFFSFRRDGPKFGNCVAFIGLK